MNSSMLLAVRLGQFTVGELIYTCIGGQQKVLKQLKIVPVWFRLSQNFKFLSSQSKVFSEEIFFGSNDLGLFERRLRIMNVAQKMTNADASMRHYTHFKDSYFSTFLFLLMACIARQVGRSLPLLHFTFSVNTFPIFLQKEIFFQKFKTLQHRFIHFYSQKFDITVKKYFAVAWLQTH